MWPECAIILWGLKIGNGWKGSTFLECSTKRRSGHGVGVISKVGGRIEVYILTPFLMEFVEAIKLCI